MPDASAGLFGSLVMDQHRRRAPLCFVLTAIATCLCPRAALADAGDAINFAAGVSQQRDSNVFRLADGINPQPLVGNSARADSITTGTLGVSLAKAYSLQQFEAGLDRVSSRHDTHTHLNNDADNARAAWHWQATPDLTGNLTLNRTQALVGFGDYTNYSGQNMRTTTATRIDADWNAFRNGWHLRAGAERYQTRDSRLFLQDQGGHIVNADLGVRLVFASANWIEFSTQGGEGRYPGRSLDVANQHDTGFSTRRSEARAHWVGGKSILEGSLGHASRHYDHFASRNYRGTVGSVKWAWTPSAALALIASWKHDFSPYVDASSSYYLQDTISISTVWQAAAKVTLSLKLDQTRRDFRGAVTPLPFTARRDRNDAIQVSAEWTPLRTVTLGAHYIDNKRDSTLPDGDYAARIAGLSLRVNI